MAIARVLARAAAGAAVPVFAVVGGGARERVQDLRRRGELCLVDSPRHATVLLVVGRLPRVLLPALAQVHDQLPRPRATVWWTAVPPAEAADRFPGTVVTGSADEDIVTAIVEVHRQLLRGDRSSDAAVLPDRPPAPWKGVGPHRQGGEGMMGGRPYGRPLPMTGEDLRDGLELDRLSLRVGPFFTPFPPGLALDVVLQGDVVQEVRVAPNPFSQADLPEASVGGGLEPGGGELFRRALLTPMPVAGLELARARHHLRWAAHALTVHGLPALAHRTLRLAASLGHGDAAAIARLRRWLERSRALHGATEGVGVIDPASLINAAGPVKRAAGVGEDDRVDDPVYRTLGFEPIMRPDGDALARWRQRLAEAEQALGLAARAAARDLVTKPRGRVEGPRGPLTDGGDPGGLLLDLLPPLLAGMEWGDAVTTLVSLDLDLEEAAARQPAGVGG